MEAEGHAARDLGGADGTLGEVERVEDQQVRTVLGRAPDHRRQPALAFRRVGWARIALAVSSGVAGALALAGTLASPVLVVLLAATAVTLWLLLRADVAAWFRR